jgi:hypothetical protein
VEELHTLPEITDVNFKDNPICCHKHLHEMVQDVVPDIEVINNEQIKEAGYRYKEQIIKLRGQIDKTGTYEGDRNLVEAEQDPDIMLDLKSARHSSLDSEDEKSYIETKAKKIGDIINQVKKNQERQERMFLDFEKNLGLKIKALIDYDDDKDQALNDPMLDL